MFAVRMSLAGIILTNCAWINTEWLLVPIEPGVECWLSMVCAMTASSYLYANVLCLPVKLSDDCVAWLASELSCLLLQLCRIIIVKVGTVMRYDFHDFGWPHLYVYKTAVISISHIIVTTTTTTIIKTTTTIIDTNQIYIVSFMN